jgi:hypothetical protein
LIVVAEIDVLGELLDALSFAFGAFWEILWALIAAYATRQDRSGFAFWPMLFDNITIRLLGSDDFPATAKQQAAADLTAAARDGALSVTIDALLPLEQAAGP